MSKKKTLVGLLVVALAMSWLAGTTQAAERWYLHTVYCGGRGGKFILTFRSDRNNNSPNKVVYRDVGLRACSYYGIDTQVAKNFDNYSDSATINERWRFSDAISALPAGYFAIPGRGFAPVIGSINVASAGSGNNPFYLGQNAIDIRGHVSNNNGYTGDITIEYLINDARRGWAVSSIVASSVKYKSSAIFSGSQTMYLNEGNNTLLVRACMDDDTSTKTKICSASQSHNLVVSSPTELSFSLDPNGGAFVTSSNSDYPSLNGRDTRWTERFYVQFIFNFGQISARKGSKRSTGWGSSEDCSFGITIDAEMTFTESRTYFACWEREDDSFSLDPNGGKLVVAEGSGYRDLNGRTTRWDWGEVSFPKIWDFGDISAARDGFRFAGWGTLANCDSGITTGERTFTTPAERLYFACWVRPSSSTQTPAPPTSAAPRVGTDFSGDCVYINLANGGVRAFRITGRDQETEGYTFRRLGDSEINLFNNDGRCPSVTLLSENDSGGNASMTGGTVRHELARHYRNWDKFGAVSGRQIPVYIDGKLTSIYGVVNSGRTYVSLSEFCFQFVCHYGYRSASDRNAKRISVHNDQNDSNRARRQVEHVIGSNSITVNVFGPGGLSDWVTGGVQAMDVPSILYGRASDILDWSSNRRELLASADVLVPVRFIAEGLGHEVSWDSTNWQAHITRRYSE